MEAIELVITFLVWFCRKGEEEVVKKLIHVGVFCIFVLSIALMVFFSLISPYHSMDVDRTLIDEDALLVLEVFWSTAVFGNILAALFTISYKKLFSIGFFALSIVALIKFISLLLI